MVMIYDAPPKTPTFILEKTYIKTAQENLTNNQICIPQARESENLGSFMAFSGSANASLTSQYYSGPPTYNLSQIPEFGPIPSEELKKSHLAYVHQLPQETRLAFEERKLGRG